MPGRESSQGAFASVAASQTDSVLVSAPTNGGFIRVLGFIINHGDTTASSVTFNTKGSGAGVAISPAFKTTANGGFVVPSSDGWFSCARNQALTVTTSAGSATGILVSYEVMY